MMEWTAPIILDGCLEQKVLGDWAFPCILCMFFTMPEACSRCEALGSREGLGISPGPPRTETVNGKPW